ncbi:MAG: sigma-70 family RNA polymerase sigma factor [Clostridia bacterium]|nr:sigma-70 family RNA polymerase sigma factor [Clostridia bacterium]
MQNRSLRADDWAAEALRKYSDMVYRLAYAQVRNRTDADDIFQEVFIRLVKSSPEFESDEHMKAWLIRVTVNCSKTMWLSSWKKRMVFWEDKDLNRIPAEEAPAGNEALEEALDSLPVKMRRVIHLFYYEEMSVDEIAEALSEKPSTIRSQLTRARKLLRKKLIGEEAKRRVQG